jgi:large subunit ribosomal protein L24
MSKLLIKKGDTVAIIAGKDKGKSGKVLQTFPKLNRVVVEGINLSKRHLRARRSGEKGQVVEFSMPIHASNVLLLDAAGQKIRHDDRPKA